MQTQTFLTPEALQFSARRNAELVAAGSVIRVAALAQPVPHKGSWQTGRLDWSNEPDRILSFAPNPSPATTTGASRDPDILPLG
jgi:hypothetical protein